MQSLINALPIKVYKSPSTSTRVPEGPWLMKLYLTPPSILPLVTLVPQSLFLEPFPNTFHIMYFLMAVT